MESPFYYPQDSQEQSHRERVSRVGLAFVTMTVVAQLAAIVVDSVVVRPLFPALADAKWYDMVLTIFCLYGISAIPTCLVLLTVQAAPPERKKMTPTAFLIFLLIGFCFMIGGSLVGQGINGIIDLITGSTQGSEITDAIHSSTRWITCLYSLVIAPVMEELFFRKFLVDRLSPLGGWVSILVSGLFFGLFHGNIDQFFYATLLGCLLAYVYANTGNILHTMLMHSIFNFFGGILPPLFTIGIPDFFPIIESGDPDAIATLMAQYPLLMAGYLFTGYLPYLFAIVGLVLLLLYYKKLTRWITPCTIPKGKRLQTVCVNGGFLSFTIISILLMFLVVVSNVLESQV